MNQKLPLIVVINPGSTSTKIALFKGEDMLMQEELTHGAEELKGFKTSLDQLDFRFNKVKEALVSFGCDIKKISAAIGRGGPVKPLTSGVYSVGESLLEDLKSRHATDHASLLGGLIAYKLAKEANVKAFIADPISVDEFEDIARISGCPEMPRISLVHALNIKAVAKETAAYDGKRVEDVNYIVAHLGGGFSICPMLKGRLIDGNNANDAGPMSPERSGTLPMQALIKTCFSGKYTEQELRRKLLGRGGLVAHLGTADCREIEERIKNGDKKAKLCLEAMGYQIAKEIGAMAAVLKGKVDAIILTGGVAYSKTVVAQIKERVSFIAPIKVRPGQNELKALADHALNALMHPEVVKEY